MMFFLLLQSLRTLNLKTGYFYTFQLLFNCIGFYVLCYAFLSAASHIYSKQAQIQVGVTN